MSSTIAIFLLLFGLVVLLLLLNRLRGAAPDDRRVDRADRGARAKIAGRRDSTSS
jgi:hypothetical protein